MTLFSTPPYVKDLESSADLPEASLGLGNTGLLGLSYFDAKTQCMVLDQYPEHHQKPDRYIRQIFTLTQTHPSPPTSNALLKVPSSLCLIKLHR